MFFLKQYTQNLVEYWLNNQFDKGLCFFFLVVSYEGLVVLFDKHGVLESSLSRTFTGSTQMKNTLLMK